MINYETLLTAAKIKNPPASWNRHADNALARPLQEMLPTREQLLVTAKSYPLPQAQIQQLEGMRRQAENDPLLAGLFQIWHTIFFMHKDAAAEAYDPWPVLSSMDESDAALFRALIIISGTAVMEQTLLSRGLSAFRQACINDYIGNTRRHFDLYGTYGLANSKMWWLWPVFLGRVFRMGRLNYEIGYYSSSYRVFRHRNGQHLLLAGEPDQRYDETGHESDNGAFQLIYEETEKYVRGNRFNSDGTFDPVPVTLDLADWSLAVKQGEPIVLLHIPGDGKLDPQAVQDSLQAAISFFRHHFSDLSFRLFTCHSWLLNTELSALLPPTSNILAFQSLFTIALANKDMDALYSFIFGVPPCPPEQLIPQTSFHVRVLSFIRDGGILWDGFGVFSFQDISLLH